MSHTLRLTQGATTIDLTSGVFAVSFYTPTTPQASIADVYSAFEDGGEQPLKSRRNIQEQAELFLRPETGQTMAQVQEKIWALETMLREAEEHQRSGAFDPVYLEFAAENTTGVWRSEILGGDLHLDANAMPRWALGKAAKVILAFTRRYFWEGAEVELALAISGASKATGGVTIYNHLDSGHANWVEIDGADIDGSIPAEMRLELTNLHATVRTDDIMIGQALFNDVDGFTHVLEAESASGGTATPYSDAASSNGAGSTVTIPQSSYGILRQWALTNTQLNAYKARRYRVIGRFDQVSNPGIYVKVVLTFPTGSTLTQLQSTGEVELGTTTFGHRLQDLGELQLPPWLSTEADFAAIDLVLYGYSDDAGYTIKVDCLFLAPADNYRRLVAKGYGLAQNSRIADDGMANALWTDGWSGGGKTGHYTGTGRRPKLWPGRTTRLHILHQSQTGGDAIDRTHTVRAYYRPRRLTV